MTDIKRWLSEIGLEQHVKKFVENDVDMEVLGQLSEADMITLDVSLGHRKKILNALRIRQDRLAQTSSFPISSEPERRYMTLVFCDLVDSTSIAARLDIEEMHDIYRAYQRNCANIAKKFGGYIARYMGDGVLIYFGYPIIREDDAERALWAGLEIIRQVSQLNKVFVLTDGMTLSVRIGIATSHVVVEIISDGAIIENAVVGAAPNLAARLQTLATPNTIVVAPDTYQLVVNTFEFSELGEQSIKGYAKPMRLWQVQRERPIEQYFRHKSSRHLTPMIDRENELSVLSSCWQRACRNEGQVVLLSGEAGIGKTRLISVLIEQIIEPYQLFLLYCSPYHSQSPLYPYLSSLIRNAGIFFDDDDQVRYLKLKNLIIEKQQFDDNFLHTIISLIALQVDNDPQPADTDAQHQLQLAQESLINFIIKLSGNQPLLIVVEDIHWIDSTTRKMFDLLVHKNRDCSIMLLFSHRLNKSLHYDQPHVTNLALSQLTGQQSQQLIAEISKEICLDESVIHCISAKGSGIPLFIEEVTKAMLENTTPSNKRYNHQTKLGATTFVPETLQYSLLSLLDGLGNEKHLLQCAAVIGNSFEKQLLHYICEQQDEGVALGLENLVKQDIIFRQSSMFYSVFQFRHTLLRDAAYESLLKKTRRKIHAMIANYLSRHQQFIAASSSISSKQIIAYHYEQSEDYRLG